MSNPYRDYRGMAYAAGIGFWEDGSLSPAIERFAALVAAAEREECAKACEELLSTGGSGDEHRDGVADCISAIRASGNT